MHALRSAKDFHQEGNSLVGKCKEAVAWKVDGDGMTQKDPWPNAYSFGVLPV